MSLKEDWIKEELKATKLSNGKLMKLVQFASKYDDLGVDPENLLGVIRYLEEGKWNLKLAEKIYSRWINGDETSENCLRLPK